MATNSTNASAIANSISRNCFILSIDFDNITSLPDSVTPTWIFLSVINGIASPPTVILNLLVIVTVLEKHRHRCVNYNIFLVALAVTDLLVGLVQPLCVFYLGCLLLKCSSPCLWYNIVAIPSMLVGIASLSTVMAMSVERYIAIEHPMYYRRVITNKKVMVAIVILWITVPTAYILSRMSTDRSETIRKLPTSLFGGLNALIILICTIKVQITAFRQRRAISIAGQTTLAQREEQQNRLKEYKQTFAMGLMVLASVILYCPVIIVIIVQAVGGNEVADDFKYISMPIFMSFIYLQSLVNPIIFSFRLSYIREDVKNKLFCCK